MNHIDDTGRQPLTDHAYIGSLGFLPNEPKNEKMIRISLSGNLNKNVQTLPARASASTSTSISILGFFAAAPPGGA